MKRSFLSILLLLAADLCFCQTYLCLAPSLTNTAGTLADRANIALEIGKQWDVFSMGLDIGKTSLARVAGRDTSLYIELRPNLNIFQQGKFTNTFTAGIGYILNAKENLVTELTSGIEYAYNQRLHFNVNFGQYFYSGLKTASNVTFFGISAMFYFKETETGSLIKKKAK
ncbi:MAG TPA: hypothetical protein VET23_11340 [Chitinophagaceae bacterium]|nr:hypothetical protein [Chitinophagaceae bacterium]